MDKQSFSANKYQPQKIEKPWQDKWEEQAVYKTLSHSDKPKKYILDMFPYPSGEGLHVGHFKLYVSSDVISRFYRMKGFNVLHPMGWDAFGLPAENYAIKTGIHPRITTEKNVSNIKKQMQITGLSYDWSREINTTDPNYYKWTQWIFLQLYKQGLAYEAEAPINWCPKDKTGLANEEVVNGKCDRCGTQVERKVIRQWILKITEYAERLLTDLDGLDWPDSIKEMQINWIGKSEGTVVKFRVEGQSFDLETFTTRVDTLFGVTGVIVAPEHPMIEQLISKNQQQKVNEYIKKVQGKSDLERTELNKEKTGVFTGSYAINPANNQKVPIWVADYVLGFYGTGAVMLVPAHDERDFAFAEKYNFPIVEVIKGDSPKLPFVGRGTLVNSGSFNGLDNEQAKKDITKHLLSIQKESKQVNYKLRDWVFSRQRYWGEPIPLVHCDTCGLVPVPEDQLPVVLPEVEQYEPTGTGESPLATIDDWVNTACPQCGGQAKRETNTMPQWAGSCWYYLRFCDTENNSKLIDKDVERYLMPVDWYLGGAEHAVLHLLYARFWHKVLYDIKVVDTKEPFLKLSSIGLVLGPDGGKMSKSKGNVISPESVINEYGADTLRMYECFMGPFENTIPWEPSSINGIYKFITRVWEIIQKEDVNQNSRDIDVALHRLIKKVSTDIEDLKMNTPIAGMMEFVNLVFHQSLTNKQKQIFLKLLAPFAPHVTEELWQKAGGDFSIHRSDWPVVDENLLVSDEAIIVIQINGKVRDQLKISLDISEEEVVKLAHASQKASKFLEGQTIKKTIYIPGKVLNIVI
jgi:leucyl-tRNA synthetase